MIRGITFSEQIFRSEDFAHYMNFFLNNSSGITKGCTITNDGVNVTIAKGYFFVRGRLLNVEDAEVIDSSQFASGYNRIVYEIDLTKENSVAEFNQGSVKVLNTETLIQEDLDDGGNVYQFALCHFQWSGSAISDFVVDAATLVIENIMADIANNYAATAAQMENAVKQLESEGFEKKSTYYSATMVASAWDTSAKTYSFEAEYPFAEYDIDIQLAPTTAKILEMWGRAKIVGSFSSNVATALGEIPTIDIPIIIKAVKKYA